MNKLTNFSFFLLWLFGFFALFAFDLWVEGVVFEWLRWNGTNKNDWFFILWWGVVVVWCLYGLHAMYHRIRDR